MRYDPQFSRSQNWGLLLLKKVVEHEKLRHKTRFSSKSWKSSMKIELKIHNSHCYEFQKLRLIQVLIFWNFCFSSVSLKILSFVNSLGQCFSTWVPRNPEVPPIPCWVPDHQIYWFITKFSIKLSPTVFIYHLFIHHQIKS